MKTVYYWGPYAEGIEIALPGGGAKLAERGQPTEVADELADRLLEQGDIWSTSSTEPTEVPTPAPTTIELAEQLGVDLSQVDGSGKEGRIVKSDVEAAAAATGGEENSPTTGATEEG